MPWLAAWDAGRFGIEGTGSYGTGLTRWLHRGGFKLLKVERHRRRLRVATEQSVEPLKGGRPTAIRLP